MVDGPTAVPFPVCVYPVRMARVNVYLPDDLADAVRAADLNVSAIAQEALAGALAAQDIDVWLDQVSGLPATGVTHEQVIEAVAAARDEFGA